MGVVTKCCSTENSDTFREFSDKLNESNSQLNLNQIISQIPEVKDSSQGLNYICSKESTNIINKISRTSFTKKLCKEMSSLEIYFFIKKIINYIISYKITKNDIIIKGYISQIQSYTKIGTNKIINELNFLLLNLKKEDEDLLLRSLSDWIKLVHLLIYLNDNIFGIYKNIEKVYKNFIFDGIYFLIKIKVKYTYESKDIISLDKIVPTQINTRVNYDTKNEVRRLTSLVEDFVNELTNYK